MYILEPLDSNELTCVLKDSSACASFTYPVDYKYEEIEIIYSFIYCNEKEERIDDLYKYNIF